MLRDLKLRSLFFAGVATLLGTGAGSAADAMSDEEIARKIHDLEQQVQELKRAQAAKFAETQRQEKEKTKVSIENGKPTIKSADEKFSASLRALVQFDSGYYMEDDLPPGTDLSSGTNFRRARLGVEGTVFENWEYNLTGEFGGSGSEGSARLQAAYLQFNGFAPVSIIAGAYAPYITLEDSAGSADTIFLERASSVDIVRSIAAGDGRSGIGVTAAGEDFFAHFAYTGAVAGDAEVFDEQQAVLGRVAALVVNDAEFKVLVGSNASYAFDLSDPTPGSPSGSVARFRDRPESRVSGTRLVDTGNINADKAFHWGVDAGAEWRNFYAEAGYFQFGADRTDFPDSANFDGWYVDATWILTGESRRYDPKRGAFRAPKVERPFTGGEDSGWGVFEAALRFSTIDLDDNRGNPGAVPPPGGIRGGVQDIWTAGFNWYANPFVRVALNYQFIDIDRLSGTGGNIGGDAQAVLLRLQFSM